MSCQRCHSWICKCPPPIIVENTELINQQAQRIAELEQQRDELFAKLDKMEGRATLAEVQRDELIAASDEAVSEMKATAWDEEGYLLNPDLDDAADSLRATIAKVKP